MNLFDPFVQFPNLVKTGRLENYRAPGIPPELLAENIRLFIKRTTGADFMQANPARNFETRIHVDPTTLPTVFESSLEKLLGKIISIPDDTGDNKFIIDYVSGGDDYHAGIRTFITLQVRPYSRTSV